MSSTEVVKRKILKVYRNLNDVVVCIDEKGQYKFYAMSEDPAMDTYEEQDIINRLEFSFKIKLEK